MGGLTHRRAMSFYASSTGDLASLAIPSADGVAVGALLYCRSHCVALYVDSDGRLGWC